MLIETHICCQDESGDKNIDWALKENTSNFVLKPQREGGGNNIYGEKVREALLEMKNSQERSGWILMDRIIPPVQSNYLIRPGESVNNVLALKDVVSELGIFGVVIG